MNTQPDLRSIPIGLIRPSTTNPRQHFDAASLNELAESIKSMGIRQPLLVRFLESDKDEFVIVDGERRFRAAQIAKLTEVLCLTAYMTDEEAIEVQMVTFLQSEKLHPLEEAEGFQRMHQQLHYDIPTIAAKVRKTENYVERCLKLTDLIPAVKTDFAANKITIGHALLISRLSASDQEKALARCYDKVWTGQGSSEQRVVHVKELQRWVQESIMLKLSTAPWDKADGVLVKSAGSCTECPKQSGANPELFNNLSRESICLDKNCFQRKMQTYMNTQRKTIQREAGQPAIMISNFATADESRKHVPTRDKWTEVRAKDREKPDVVPAIIVEGKGLGRTLYVKVKKEKPKEASKPIVAPPPSPKALAAERERKAQYILNQIYSQKLAALLPTHASGKLTTDQLRYIGEYMADAIWSDDITAAAAATFGIKSSNRIPLTGKRLVQYVQVMATLTNFDQYSREEGFALLVRTAKAWGINVAKIKKEVQQQIKTTPKCEQCGCTEFASCLNGCHWSAEFTKQNRHVCSNCVAAVQKKDAEKKTEPTKPAETKPKAQVWSENNNQSQNAERRGFGC